MSSIIATGSCHQSSRLEIYWEETRLVLTANVHGLRSEEVMVQIRDRRVFLMIGESHECYGTSFEMPQNVNLNKAKTFIYNGVLTVTMPKLKQQPKKNIRAPVVSDAHGSRSRFFC
ncbi:hypothetical protein JRO89_XS15G0088700 [Xanthoceras sorbifolium]|uniref:SHSP domain-containing protein n=1 Tax=Xanthoceras sorbifolium TaxID=99658 RepID=A0ABQ8H1F8_9ROSI|nr:hypothetical protein JRO89_XS15G0088700 [Xanthoceras sorbifolium]